jgi:hypothetical protein
MIMETRNDLEQVLRRLLLMRQDEHALAAVAARAVIETAGDVSRAALLAALEDQRADLADIRALRLELLMDKALRAIERKRRDRA